MKKSVGLSFLEVDINVPLLALLLPSSLFVTFPTYLPVYISFHCYAFDPLLIFLISTILLYY